MFRAQFLVLFILYGRTKFTFKYFFLFAYPIGHYRMFALEK
jgi:hypothetical protein